ncbi:GNAT family N-acetyltransferase [Ornithinibacillus salinisoli]|uniref:GNAT family N-acetyltransferase n=1 Tax=Ornithinibacillus salinisoli TaxID=1848459 RepID=A0ABW4VX16_9BACI
MQLLLNKEFANSLEKSEVIVLNSRLTGIQERAGNPMGVEVKKFGNATAFTAQGIPGPSYNTVKGITGDDVAYLDEIISFYQDKDIPVRFEISPASATLELFQRLHKQGFYQRDFHTTLYGAVNDLKVSEDASIAIRMLEQDEFDLYAELYVRGFSMPDFLKEFVAQNNEVLHSKEQWQFYLATKEDDPVGIGVLFVKGGIGTLAAAATAPEYRNQGVHRALVSYRIKDAKKLGCQLIVGQASFGSTSQCNMERAGLRIAYTKAIWEQSK